MTKERAASIRSTADDGSGGWSTKNKMAYYFSVVEDLLGLKDEIGPNHGQSLAD